MKEEICMWTMLGKFYGYPKCCIDSFKSLSHIFGESRKLNGTGYVPCEECNKKTEKELLENISKNRVCPSEFPKECSEEAEIESVINSSKFTEEEKDCYKDFLES